MSAPFSRRQWWQLLAFYLLIAGLHLAGWGLHAGHVAAHPALAGLGLAAYLLGVRHAFDADHIAAIDDTTRWLVQRGQTPLGIGFFFSLGHSSVVLALAVAIGLAGSAVQRWLPGLESAGSLVGAAVSGLFLLGIGLVNLKLLVDIARRRPAPAHAHRHEPAPRGGLLARCLGRSRGLMTRSWHMYPLGLLFGLGFDTASEIALLALTAGAAAGSLPLAGVLSLPLLFAAGMSLMDTTDGLLMIRAYRWSQDDPARRRHYNLVMTGLSAFVALAVGGVGLAKWTVDLLALQGPRARHIEGMDVGLLGYAMVAVCLLCWGLSVLVWRSRARARGMRSGHA